MIKMICQYCGKEVLSADPHSPESLSHHECYLKMQDEMEELKMIEIVDRAGIEVAWKLSDNFEKFFYNSLNETRNHVIHDETVDEDIVDLQGVIKAVLDFLPRNLSPEKLFLYSSFLFNSLMRKKYGRSLPNEKKFHSRLKEFMKEVSSFPISEENADYLKMIFGKWRNWGV